MFASCNRSSFKHPVSWLEVERRIPLIDIPHVVRVGEPEYVIRRRAGDKWQELVRSKLAPTVSELSSGDAILVQTMGGAVIVRADVAHVIRLPSRSCDSAVVAPDGTKIVCAECNQPGPGFARCSRFEFFEYDAQGRAIAQWEHVDDSRECGVATNSSVVFTEQVDDVIALECHGACRLLGAKDWKLLTTKPGICTFDDLELSALNLRRARASFD